MLFGLLLLALLGNVDEGPLRVVVFGDSLSAGFGVDKSQAFPALLEERARAEGWSVEVINAGVSGDTSAGGLRRIDWTLRGSVDVLILELGANDGLRGIATEATEANLQAIIDRTRAKFGQAHILVAGMKLPPNLGREYVRAFEAIFPRLAETNDLDLIPFLLEGVATRPELNLADGIHPNKTGHQRIAETVWPYLERALKAVSK
jgi:acyl-CoA thioesterase-1